MRKGIITLLLVSFCSTQDLREWKELAKESKEEANKALLEKARKSKDKAIRKVEEL